MRSRLRISGFVIGMFLATLEGWKALLRSFTGAGNQLYRRQRGLQRRKNFIGRGSALSLHRILRSGKSFQGGVWLGHLDRLWSWSGLLDHYFHPAILRAIFRRQIICKWARIGVTYCSEVIGLQTVLFAQRSDHRDSASGG